MNPEPTRPGWYASVNGTDYLIYLRLPDINIAGVFTRVGQWRAYTADGDATDCDWAYIDQAGPVVPLIKQYSPEMTR